MEELYPEFFNDVFGPIMQPGSSSHTAGPCRLGYIANSLLNSPVKKIHIILDPKGSFAGTFGVMNEDLGMLAGAYGLLPDNERLFEIKNILKEERISYDFEFSTIKESSHANAVKFILTSKNGKVLTFVGNSIGGGMIETVMINGFPFKGKCDTYVYFILDKNNQYERETVINEFKSRYSILSYGVNRSLEKGTLYWYTSENKIESLDEFLEAFPKVEYTMISPILPVTTTKKKKPQLYNTFTDWIRISKERNQGLYETAIDYEMDASGWSKDRIISNMEKIREYMEGQIKTVYKDDSNLLETPFSGYHFRDWKKYKESKETLVGNTVSLALYYAFGVQALVKGVKMVPGPMGTGGGFIYSVLEAARETKNLSHEDMMRGLFIAASVGAICYSRTDPTGEIIGCAGECGMCASMAAAGLTEMLKGTPEEVECAASLTLQAAIGWPCDPIPGGDNQPCLSRVITAVTMAITFSEVAMSGRKCVIPFHEVVDLADKVGRNMPDGLKCTSRGGLCDTPTGIKCKMEFENWYLEKSKD
ncbi:MAG: hypothetical protein GX275_08985 [Clostridiales bacterium]|nr:hypothetical protein [Clostridiales bacterium]